MNNIKYQNMERRLNEMSIEQLKAFLKSFSSRLRDTRLHCRDLVDLATDVAYITSVEGSGLTVTNTSNRNMSEKIYLKAMSILDMPKIIQEVIIVKMNFYLLKDILYCIIK